MTTSSSDPGSDGASTPPPTVASEFTRALGLGAARRYREALAAYESSLQLAAAERLTLPASTVATMLIGLAECHSGLGEWDAARADYDRAESLLRHDQSAAQALATARQIDLAYQPDEDLRPGLVTLYESLGRACAVRRDWLRLQTAGARLLETSQALAQDATIIIARRYLAEAYLQLGAASQARNELEALVELERRIGHADLARDEALLAQLRAYLVSKSAGPAPSADDALALLRRLYAQGDQAFDARDYAQAGTCYAQALTVVADLGRQELVISALLYNLGLIAAAQNGDDRQAVPFLDACAHLRRAHDQTEAGADTLVRLAAQFGQIGQAGKALRALDAAIGIYTARGLQAKAEGGAARRAALAGAGAQPEEAVARRFTISAGEHGWGSFTVAADGTLSWARRPGDNGAIRLGAPLAWQVLPAGG